MATMMREYLQSVSRDDGEDPQLAARCAIPALPRHYVDRPRLSAALDEGTALPLTLVSAPAGSGKTTAVAAWAQGRSGQSPATQTIGWVTFAVGDDNPSIHWPLVMASLRRCGVSLAPEALSPPRLQRRMLSLLGAALAEREHPVILVLDGYETADAELVAGLEFLISHSGGRLRLVLLTRVDPGLPLHRFRLSDSMAELRMADLAFLGQEAAELIVRSGLEVPDTAVEALVDRTRGWAAGLRFGCIALAQIAEPDGGVTWLTGDTGPVAEYLMTEVLATQPRDVRDTLLRTSVVETLQPGLMEALGGRFAARTLASLAHANVLVQEVPSTPGWYRYHPLMRELLLAELTQASPARLAGLERRAAAWYEAESIDSTADPQVVVSQRTAVRGAVTAPVRAPRPMPDGYILEPLTAKEREVLGHLSELLSTKEIADTMFVSVNTVRTHVRNILRKLGVTRRNDAVRRARSLDLLDPGPIG